MARYIIEVLDNISPEYPAIVWDTLVKAANEVAGKLIPPTDPEVAINQKKHLLGVISRHPRWLVDYVGPSWRNKDAAIRRLSHLEIGVTDDMPLRDVTVEMFNAAVIALEAERGALDDFMLVCRAWGLAEVYPVLLLEQSLGIVPGSIDETWLNHNYWRAGISLVSAREGRLQGITLQQALDRYFAENAAEDSRNAAEGVVGSMDAILASRISAHTYRSGEAPPRPQANRTASRSIPVVPPPVGVTVDEDEDPFERNPQPDMLKSFFAEDEGK